MFVHHQSEDRVGCLQLVGWGRESQGHLCTAFTDICAFISLLGKSTAGETAGADAHSVSLYERLPRNGFFNLFVNY